MAERVSLSYRVVSGLISEQMARTIAEIGEEADGFPARVSIDVIKRSSMHGREFLLGIHKGKPVAVISYSENEQNKTITTYKTSIPKPFQRKGIATKMIYRLIGMAREKGYKIKRSAQNSAMVNLTKKMRLNPRKRFIDKKQSATAPERIFFKPEGVADGADAFIFPRKRRHLRR